MARPKRSQSNNQPNLPDKKQRISAINWLCNKIYPNYKSSDSNYGFIKDVLSRNQNLYPWLTRDMLYNGLRRIEKH